MTRLATSFNTRNIRKIEAPIGGQMDYDRLRQVVPSLYAEGAHESRSNRYAYVPTIDIMRGLWKDGWAPTLACEARSRDVTKRGFTKHMVRFARRDGLVGSASIGARSELIMINSHDGATSYQMLAGLFRFVCCNGMVAGDIAGEVRVQHKGDILGQVIEGSYTVAKDFRQVESRAEDFRRITLNRDEQLVLAEAAHEARYGEDDGTGLARAIRPQQLLLARRSADTGNDLWSTFNRVQENVIRGGLSGVAQGSNGRLRRTSSRPVAGIDQDVKLNRILWKVAESMAAIKTGSTAIAA